MADWQTQSLLTGECLTEDRNCVIDDMAVAPTHRPKRYLVPFGKRVPRIVKEVWHRGRKMTNINIDVFPWTWYHEIGACDDRYGRIVASTALELACQRWGKQWVHDNVVVRAPTQLTSADYTGADWFSMMSEFNEKLDSLVPSDFLSGEMFAEGSIFIDAIRLALRPKRVLLGLIKDLRRRRLTRLPVGEAHHHYRRILSTRGGIKKWEMDLLAQNMGIPLVAAKDVVNAHLLYQFGVKPAIQEAGKLLSANNVVGQQLAFLNRNRGRYVPIRVRRVTGFDQKAPYDFSPGYVDVDVHLASTKTVNVLFGQARVRTDINEASRWRAYAEYFGLNKVVGTAWELIPFSFVVDWVTNAQERLNDLTRLRLGEGPFVGLRAVGHSIKRVATYEALLLPGYDFSVGMPLRSPDSPTRMFDIQTFDYRRSPGLPDTSGVVDVSTLGLFHGVTFGELLYQKLT